MDKRKRKKDLEKGKKRRKIKSEIILEELPIITNINDLINIAETNKLYKNIDIFMLWKIVPYLKELNQMVGMDHLKSTIFLQVIYYLKSLHIRNIDGEYLHTVIYGPPGTGKTSVSKIIGNIYQAMGVLPDNNNKFRIAHRDDFVAEYTGQTAIKTRKLLNSCLGGVLFIDEAYSLGEKEHRDSFAKEAIDVLNSFLSEHKNDMCCIIAGYEDEIKKCLFKFNEGLERRFSWIHRIEPYSPEQLIKILLKMIKEINWEIDIKNYELEQFIKQNIKTFKYAGGDIETFLTKCKMAHAKRVINLDNKERFILKIEDFKEAISIMKERNEKNKNEPPFGLYF